MEDIYRATSLAQLINFIRVQSAPGSVTNEYLAGVLDTLNAVKVDKEEGKGLSTNDFTDLHVESLKHLLPDWIGSQQEYNELEEHEPGRWFLIEEDQSVVALYRGDRLVYAVPNLVGQFREDSMPDEWFWTVDGKFTPLPVDPVTKRFSLYWPHKIQSISFEKSVWTGECLLTRLERMPQFDGYFSGFCQMSNCEVFPVIDCLSLTSLSFLFRSPIRVPEHLYFKNTEKIETLNSLFPSNQAPKYLHGFDCSSLGTVNYHAFGLDGPAYMKLTNLGVAEHIGALDLRNRNWGDDTIAEFASSSLWDSLPTFDRVAAGYDSCTLIFSAELMDKDILRPEYIEYLSDMGYTVIFQK